MKKFLLGLIAPVAGSGSLLALLALSIFNLQFSTASAAVTFTITPSAVSNTYNGQITLTIAGLSNGGSVVVQKFIDANTNGRIDGTDWLVQQFTLTDGQPGMVIGGVTNFNVPGDTDTTAGQITAKLNFQAGDFSQNFIGKYLVKISGSFTPPVTNVFTVTNFPFAQKFTGNVVSNGTSTVVANVPVLLFPPGGNGGPVAGAIANNAGSYTIMAPAGTYSLAAFRSNYLANFGNAPTLTLGGGVTITTNISMTKATASISGQVVDANNSSLGLPGTLVTAQGNGGMMGIGYTDTNGNFVLGVQSGQWGVKPDDTSLIVHGYLGLQNKTSVTAGPALITLAVPRATALIYGSVKDNLGNPFAALDVYANDENNNLYDVDGYTDANGNYVLGVLGLGTDDPWWAQANSDNQIANYVFTQETIDGSVSAGSAALQDYTAILATNVISGNVSFNGVNLSGVWVSANTEIGGMNYQTGMDTDNNGNYSFNVANGSWNVSLETCGGSDSLDNLLGSGSYVPPADQTAIIAGQSVTNNFLVLQPDSQITGHVQDSSGVPVVGAAVYADATIGGESYEAWTGTDNNGNYSLNVVSGNWNVSVLCDGGSPCGNYNSLDNLLGSGNHQCPGSQQVNTATGSKMANFVIQVCSGVQILTTNLPDGQVNVYYDQYLQGSSCNGTLNWSLNDPLDFPSSLGWSGNGEIQGTPNASGTYYFTVHLDDGNGHSADQYLSLYIAPASSPLAVATIALAYGTNGAFYSQTLQASGGQAPYSWSIPDYSASLPPNLTLTTNGVLSGTPATSAGWYYFDVVVTDAANNTADSTLELYVYPAPAAPLVITNSVLPPGTAGTAYSAQLGATGGQTPYTWQLALGSASLPAGLSLGSDGSISGKPTTVKTNTFKVQVTDANYTTTNKIFSLVISSNFPPSIASCSIAGANMTINVTDGVAGKTYILLASTNLAWSLSQWMPVATNVLSSGNRFTMTATNAVSPPARQKFFILQAQ